MTSEATRVYPTPMYWSHPEDASKHATEMGLIAHPTFECDLREGSRAISKHELFGSKHPKSRKIDYRRQSEGFVKPVRKTAVAEACHAGEVAHSYARGEIGLNVAHNAPGTPTRHITARSGERSLLRIALTNFRLGKLFDIFDTLDTCFETDPVITSVGR